MLNGMEAVGPGDRHIASRVFAAGAPPCVIAINKVDRMRPAQIAATIAAAAELGDFQAVHPISARTGEGVDALLADLVAMLDEGPAYFPEGITTDLSDELRMAEAVREAALRSLREEVPHAVAAVVEEVSRRRRSTTVVRAVLICETESQKRILVGARGAMIKRIGVDARPAVERILGEPVFLDLTVKVRPRWRRDEAELDRLGI